jgi:putative ATPase
MTLVQCPICSIQVKESEINTHLDNKCNLVPSTDAKQPKVQTTFQTPKKQIEQKAIELLNVPKKRKRPIDSVPLADRVRPLDWDGFTGHQACESGSVLREMVLKKKIPSIIIWGPPGCGKTTLARILGRSSAYYREFSATIHSIQDIRHTALNSKNSTETPIFFVDEIHRFTKAQQDVFLSFVEKGDFVLIGATTENPSFRINNALLSRCRVFILEKLSVDALLGIMKRACVVENFDSTKIPIEMLLFIANMCDGDARVALNTLEAITNHSNPSIDIVKEIMLKSNLLYDRNGEEHYNVISALHKSVRGSDDNAALYWLGRMIKGGEDPLYVARRLVRMASEDIGLADPQALPLAMSTYQAVQVIGMPESDCILAQCVTYLARAPKSVETYQGNMY